jgi:hypothetical protein
MAEDHEVDGILFVKTIPDPRLARHRATCDNPPCPRPDSRTVHEFDLPPTWSLTVVKDVSREANGSPTSRKTGAPDLGRRHSARESLRFPFRAPRSMRSGRATANRLRTQSGMLSVGVAGTLGCRQKMTRLVGGTPSTDPCPSNAPNRRRIMGRTLLSCQTSRSQPQSRPRPHANNAPRCHAQHTRGAVVPRVCDRTNLRIARVTNHSK